MKLIKILFKSGEQAQYVVKDEVLKLYDFASYKVWSLTEPYVIFLNHVGGDAFIRMDDVALLEVLDKNIVMTARTKNIPSGKIRVRRLRNPLEYEKHYENPCN